MTKDPAQPVLAGQPDFMREVAESESAAIAAIERRVQLLEARVEAIRPHNPQHIWRPARPYMLPG